MPSEGIEAKARRYLTEGRVAVVKADAGRAHFTVAGSASYDVHYMGEWTCNCPAQVTPCAHIFACQLVTKFDLARKISFQDADDDFLDDLLNG